MDVFVVDDADLLRKRLIGVLSEITGVRIMGEANSVASALAGIAQHQPELLILDVRLPDGTGFDILKSVRQTYPAMVVLMISGEPFPQYREHALKNGAMYFFDKTRDLDQIERVVTAMARLNSDNKTVRTV